MENAALRRTPIQTSMMYNPNFRQHGFVGSVICNTYATRDKILTFNNISSICSTNTEKAHYLSRKMWI